MFRLFLLIVFIGFFINGWSIEPPVIMKPVKAEVVKTTNGYELYRDGKPYYIKGGGYAGHMKELAEAGGNSIRTWGADSNSMDLLNDAQKYNLTVAMGLWVGHERHGFNYSDPIQVMKQYVSFSNTVEQLKNHPALLMWGVGNEFHTGNSTDKVWKAAEDIAALIHRIDPNHPTMTVIANARPDLIEKVQKLCPSIDILGVNEYGNIYNIYTVLTNKNWDRPFVITEWGTEGWWASPKTGWNAYIEFPSGIKRDVFIDRYNIIHAFPSQCAGSYVFLWGQKQERTGTWFGLFLDSGEKTEMENAMEYCWKGSWPKYRAPNLTGIMVNGKSVEENVTIEAGGTFKVELTLEPVDRSKLTYTWQIFEESASQNIGGDAEPVPAKIKTVIVSSKGNETVIKAPAKEGTYRIFVKVLDGHGNAATANFPFAVF
jgi:hypothetical protein